MTSLELQKEFEFRYRERLAILIGSDRPPTAEEDQMARQEALQSIEAIQREEQQE